MDCNRAALRSPGFTSLAMVVAQQAVRRNQNLDEKTRFLTWLKVSPLQWFLHEENIFNLHIHLRMD
jgi:hypothetical protein